MRQLEKDTRRSQQAAFAESTIRNLMSQWNKFQQFCSLAKNVRLPVSSHQLSLYVQFLSRSLKAPSSIRNYVSGLKTIHTLMDIPFPDTKSLDVRLTLRGLERLTHYVPRKAVPVTPSLLVDIYNLLDMTQPIDVVFWCLFLFMFFLLGRKSQFLPDSTVKFDSHKLLSRSKVTLFSDHIRVSFSWTKTLQFGGQILHFPLFPIPNSPLCPVTAFLTMVSLVPASPRSPAFVYPSGKALIPITYRVFQRIFKSLVSMTGRDPTNYSSHSFRRGAQPMHFQLGSLQIISKHWDIGIVMRTRVTWIFLIAKDYMMQN